MPHEYRIGEWLVDEDDDEPEEWHDDAGGCAIVLAALIGFVLVLVALWIGGAW